MNTNKFRKVFSIFTRVLVLFLVFIVMFFLYQIISKARWGEFSVVSIIPEVSYKVNSYYAAGAISTTRCPPNTAKSLSIDYKDFNLDFLFVENKNVDVKLENLVNKQYELYGRYLTPIPQYSTFSQYNYRIDLGRLDQEDFLSQLGSRSGGGVSIGINKTFNFNRNNSKNYELQVKEKNNSTSIIPLNLKYREVRCKRLIIDIPYEDNPLLIIYIVLRSLPQYLLYYLFN